MNRGIRATSESGDLLDLWQQVRGLSFVDALNEARQYLGIERPTFEPIKSKVFKRPDKPRCQKPQGEGFRYLTEVRKLKREIIELFQVGETSDALVFPYKRGDELIMAKTLKLERSNDKKVINVTPQCEPALFGWQAIDANAKEVVICEGEIDAMSLKQYGIDALSVPFGGGDGNKQRWIEYEYPNLERFKTIYVWMDNDEQGQIAALEIINRLGSHRCRLVEWVEGINDANDALQQDLMIEAIQSLLEDAQTLDPEELKPATYFTDEVIAEFYPSDEATGNKLPWAKMDGKVQLRTDELSIWTGINGHGKSQFLGQVMIGLMKQDVRVCIASLEIKPRRLLYRLVRQIGGLANPTPGYIEAMMDWLSDRLWIFDLTGTTKTDRLLEVFEYARRRYGIDHFVIDSLMKCGISEDDYRSQKAFIEQLCDFKNKFGVHVHCVAHSRKGENESRPVGKMDVKGSGAITDLADNAFSLWRNKSKEEKAQQGDYVETTDPDALLICDKQRNGEWEGKVAFWFDKESFQFLAEPEDKPRRYVDYESSMTVIPHQNNQGEGLQHAG